MAKNTGKVREFCQSGKVGTLNLSVGMYVWVSVYARVCDIHMVLMQNI